MLLSFLKSLPKTDKETKKRLYTEDGTPRTLFLYTVTGSKKDLEKYLEIQCEQSGLDEKSFKSKDGKHVIYFTEFALADTVGKLIITDNDNLAVDNSAVAIATSLLKQHPGPIGIMLAKKHLFASTATDDSDLAHLVLDSSDVDNG